MLLVHPSVVKTGKLKIDYDVMLTLTGRLAEYYVKNCRLP